MRYNWERTASWKTIQDSLNYLLEITPCTLTLYRCWSWVRTKQLEQTPSGWCCASPPLFNFLPYPWLLRWLWGWGHSQVQAGLWKGTFLNGNVRLWRRSIFTSERQLGYRNQPWIAKYQPCHGLFHLLHLPRLIFSWASLPGFSQVSNGALPHGSGQGHTNTANARQLSDHILPLSVLTGCWFLDHFL